MVSYGNCSVSDHPVCAASEASQLLLLAQPPLLTRRGISPTETNRAYSLGGRNLNGLRFSLFLLRQYDLQHAVFVLGGDLISVNCRRQ